MTVTDLLRHQEQLQWTPNEISFHKPIKMALVQRLSVISGFLVICCHFKVVGIKE